ncbi:DUF6565 domain-containing protein [Flavobacterium sp. LT1R49]|uniref:DUF6565 domain-containing protein n=1 Tax=Flavobacterium arabinosi TaxID=3398737 RepID=UPI003A85B979
MFRKSCYTLLFVTLLSACSLDNNRESYISNLDSFVKSTSENYKNFEEEDWKKADSLFANFQTVGHKKWKSEFTPEESVHVNELMGKYHAIKVKAGILNLKEGVNDMIQQAVSFINKIATDSTLTKQQINYNKL